MKKIKLPLTFLLLILFLCGCSGGGDETTTEVLRTTHPVATTAETVTQYDSETGTTEAQTVAQTTLPSTVFSTTEQTFSTSVSSAATVKTDDEEKTTAVRSILDIFSIFNKKEKNEETKTTSSHSTTKKKVEQTTTKSKPPATVATTKPPVATTSKKDVAYLTISVVNIKNNLKSLPKAKQSFVTKSGYILKKRAVEIEEGNTAFDVLKKGCQENRCEDGCSYCKNGVQLEYSYTPAYKSYYIEGIHQLYEKDCGAMSGWIFKINGTVADASSSTVEVNDGDTVEFVYTLDGGGDIT